MTREEYHKWRKVLGDTLERQTREVEVARAHARATALRIQQLDEQQQAWAEMSRLEGLHRDCIDNG